MFFKPVLQRVSRRALLFWAVVGFVMSYTAVQTSRLWPGLPSPAVIGCTAVLFYGILGWQFYYRAHPAAIDRAWFSWIAWIASFGTGIWASFILLSMLVEAGGFIARLAGFHGAHPTREVVAAVVAVASVLSLVGLGEVLNGPVVREISVLVAGLPEALDGMKIAHISDLHIGPMVRRGYIERVVRLVAAQSPDLIAVTGDLADGTVASLEKHLKPLAGLRAPLGTFYVTGNHEYYWNVRAWLRKARELGFTPLVDENRVVERGGARVLVGGVADTSAPYFEPSHESSPSRAARTEEPADFRILLAHRPQSYLEGERAGFDLQLSGHTHGGQFFPFSLATRFFHRYHRGLNRHGRMWVYVNPGTGYWGPPHRFLVPAEITLLRLVRK